MHGREDVDRWEERPADAGDPTVEDEVSAMTGDEVLATTGETDDVAAGAATTATPGAGARWRAPTSDVLTPIDPTAPVSGHVVLSTPTQSVSAAPEHDWAAAAPRIHPLLRPTGTGGLRFDEFDPERLAASALRSGAESLVDEGPAGLAVVYALTAGPYDVIVSAEHLLGWNVGVADVQDAAVANLRAWSSAAGWTEERSTDRRLLSSQSGDGWDAARILLPEVRELLATELGDRGRILVGLPERHLLVAGASRPNTNLRSTSPQTVH